MAAVVSGALTFALLVVVGRAVGPADYARFGGFWAAVVITSVGAFLPFEQVVGRRAAVGPIEPGTAVAVRRATTAVAGLAASAVAGGLLATGSSPVVALAFAVACAGFALQFPARGLLAGTGLTARYAAVIVADTLARAVVASALAAAGVSAPEPYAAAVALSALLSGVLATRLARRTPEGGHAAPGDVRARLGAEVGGLVVAMLAMQAVLNSGNLVAATQTGPDAVAAGHLAAGLTIVRMAVFVQQFGQAAYLPRVARAHALGDAGLPRLLAAIAAAVGGAGLATIAGSAALGPGVVRLVYGADFDLSPAAAALLGSGVALFLAAAVANDIVVAVAAPRRVAPAWVLGAAVAAVPAVACSGLVARVGLPLVVGSAVALAALAPTVVRLGGRA